MTGSTITVRPSSDMIPTLFDLVQTNGAGRIDARIALTLEELKLLHEALGKIVTDYISE